MTTTDRGDAHAHMAPVETDVEQRKSLAFSAETAMGGDGKKNYCGRRCLANQIDL